MKRTDSNPAEGLGSAPRVVSVSDVAAISPGLDLTESQSPTRVRIPALRRLGGPLLSVAVLAGAAIAAVALASLSPETPAAASPPPARVGVRPVEFASSFEIDRSFIGVVRSAQRSVLGFPRSERVTEITTDEGRTVQSGDVIARLDTELLDAERQALDARLASANARLDELVRGPRAEDIAQARADAERARADLELATATLARLETSLAKDAISAQRYDEGRLARDAAAAVHDAARARLERLENGTRDERIAAQRAEVRGIEAELVRNRVAREDSVLTAPFSGRVAVRHVDVGTVVAAGEPIVELLELGRTEVRVGLPIGVELEQGRAYDVTIGDRRTTASFVRSLPERSLQSRTTEALLELEDSTVRVRSGDAVTLHLVDEHRADGSWIPLEALSQSVRGLWSCSVVVANQIERRELRLLHTEAGRAYVTGALESGDLVVTDGAHRVVPGQAVVAESEGEAD